jgi:hypothetical protein
MTPPGFRVDDWAGVRLRRHLALGGMCCALLIPLLIAMSLKQTPAIIDKARLIALIGPIFEGRVKVGEHHALTGDWLDETGSPDEENPPRPDALSARIGLIRQGAVHIEVHHRKKNDPDAPAEWWSIRPAVMASDAPTVLWVCGSRAPPVGFHAAGEDWTSVPPEVNYQFCQPRQRAEPEPQR